MKYLLLLSLFASASAWGKTTVINFTQVLTKDLQTDIKKDDEKFKTERSRGPASVEPEGQSVILEVPKLDKNVRQIGPNKW